MKIRKAEMKIRRVLTIIRFTNYPEVQEILPFF